MISSALLCLQNSLRVHVTCAKVSHFAINPRCGLLRMIIIDKLINRSPKVLKIKRRIPIVGLKKVETISLEETIGPFVRSF